MRAHKGQRREELVAAGLMILSEEGLAGFSQPKVAARANIKQGHLTYVFPTRKELLIAVARAAIADLLVELDALVDRALPINKIVPSFAAATSNPESRRLVLALCQAADQEPQVRVLLDDMKQAALTKLHPIFRRLMMDASQPRVEVFYAVLVGLYVMGAGSSGEGGASRNKAAILAAFKGLGATLPA